MIERELGSFNTAFHLTEKAHLDDWINTSLHVLRSEIEQHIDDVGVYALKMIVSKIEFNEAIALQAPQLEQQNNEQREGQFYKQTAC